ncbi:MAG TPA: Gfo/Idh/MocA family oxidoreductase [Myxococcaceae bacterium]|nr:Gfo/Idh/MocA family oxidoreductase [Myxococcaceae bacterium]
MANGKKKARNGRKLGYAVVGVGHIAQAAVLPAFEHAENAKLVALVSGDKEKREELGKRYGVKTYSYDDYEECLASPEVDAVYIALPNTLHTDYVVKAARHGVHVLCEKPMALRVEECERMIRECREHDVKLMVAYRLHFEECNMSVVELARSGRLGTPRFFTSEFSYQVQPGNIRTDAGLGGGPLWDIGIYCINAARYLFRAEPTEVFAYGTGMPDERFEGLHDTVAAVLKFPDDRVASFTCSFSSTTTGDYRLVCTEGEVRLENAYEYEGEKKLMLKVDEVSETKTFAPRDQFAPELVYFGQCILEDREPEPSGEEGLADIRIISALEESMRHRRPVELEPFEKRSRPDMSQEMYRPPVKEPELVDAQAPTQ